MFLGFFPSFRKQQYHPTPGLPKVHKGWNFNSSSSWTLLGKSCLRDVTIPVLSTTAFSVVPLDGCISQQMRLFPLRHKKNSFQSLHVITTKDEISIWCISSSQKKPTLQKLSSCYLNTHIHTQEKKKKGKDNPRITKYDHLHSQLCNISMANRCRLPVKDDCSFLFLKLHYYFLKFLMDKAYDQNKDVMNHVQHVICNLCFKCLSTLCSPFTLYMAVPEVCRCPALWN